MQLVLFFFQAEDGIRDVAVTGVQTCALPISPPRPGRPPGWPPHSAPARRSAWRDRACARRSEEHTSELQSRLHLVCRLLLEKKQKKIIPHLPFIKKKKKQIT